MKSPISLIILAALGFAFMTGCNAKKDEKTYAYDYEYNGCKTGRQEYGSVEEMCAGLKDDSRNNYCAASIRADAYQQNCAGGQVSSTLDDLEGLEEGDFF